MSIQQRTKSEILNADCFDYLQTIDDESVDLIITDPPYGDNTGYGRQGKEIINNEDETINYRVIPILYKKLKKDSSMYIFTNWKFCDKIRKCLEDTHFTIKMMLVIYKNNISMGMEFRNQYELCFVCDKGEPSYRLRNFSNVIKMQDIEHNDDSHPHEKGIEMITKMLLHSSNRGDVVLDCFMGSGSTAIACVNLDRIYLGCELDEKYFKLAKKRLQRVEGINKNWGPPPTPSSPNKPIRRDNKTQTRLPF